VHKGCFFKCCSYGLVRAVRTAARRHASVCTTCIKTCAIALMCEYGSAWLTHQGTHKQANSYTNKGGEGFTSSTMLFEHQLPYFAFEFEHFVFSVLHHVVLFLPTGVDVCGVVH